MFPAVGVTGVPGMLRLLPDESAQAFVASLKSDALKRMYGRGFSGSVTEKFGEKFVPAPFAAVFQPPNVNPGLTIVPTVGRFDSAIGDKVFTI
jgi:hypothetical protein